MKVVTFGELMVRLQPFNYERFVQANSLEFSFGGGEANVAVSLANYGLDAAFVTKLPAHAIGQAAVNSLRRYGVDTSMITRGGDRVGIYYNEKGASQRGSVCIYDRANSAIQLAQPSDFDWDKIFEGVDWFHFTGITPALGENVVEICREAQFHIMFDQKDRHMEFFSHKTDHVHQFPRLVRVHARSGLVEQQKLRFCRHRSGDLKPSLLSVRKIRGGNMRHIFQIEHFQKFHCLLIHLFFHFSVTGKS